MCLWADWDRFGHKAEVIPVRINVADLLTEAGQHKAAPVAVAMEPVEFGGQVFHFDRPLTGEVEIWNTGDSLLVKGSLAGEVLIQCSRCLAPITLPLDLSFEEEFVEGEPPAEGEEAGDEGDDDRTITYFQGDEIDLTEALQQNILLELPMKPLCSEDCLGLCPTCGANRNETSCTCQQATDVDPRLAALKDLLRKPDSNS